MPYVLKVQMVRNGGFVPSGPKLGLGGYRVCGGGKARRGRAPESALASDSQLSITHLSEARNLSLIHI